MEEFTIQESYTLPSNGMVYNDPVDPAITLRSMTTQEEMRRLSTSVEAPYKSTCDVIDACIVGQKPGVSAYDMCLGDYQFLLHKLRTVTYGPEYKLEVKCDACGNIFTSTCNLDDLEKHEWEDGMEELKVVELPASKKKIVLKTP